MTPGFSAPLIVLVSTVAKGIECRTILKAGIWNRNVNPDRLGDRNGWIFGTGI